MKGRLWWERGGGGSWTMRGGPLGAAASRGCCGGVRKLRDREDVGSMGTLGDREDVDSMETLGDREASEVFIPLGGDCPGIAGWS